MKKKTTTATILFIIGILLAGAANAWGRQIVTDYGADPGTPAVLPFYSTLMFCVNLLLYVSLMIFWIYSVQKRLLPTRERAYMIAAACCAIGMLLLRSIKYRLIDDRSFELLRYAWYLYYVPMTLLPTLFLMTCIRVEGGGRGRFDERLLMIPAGVIILLFLTNDLHYLAFCPTKGLYNLNGGDDTYTNGPLLYIYYGYFAVTVLFGMICLTRANSRSRSFKTIALPFVFLLGMLGLVMLNKALSLVQRPSMFTMPEIIAFGMIGVFESCIRNRLISCNGNYAGFFSQMRFPAIITHRDLTVAHRSAIPLTAGRPQLEAALAAPVYTDENTKLTGKPITAGCAFYSEDESELNRLNEKLVEANELLFSENELIRAENDLNARKAQVDSRNMIYERISEKMLPYHRRALRMIGDIHPDDADFSEQIARLNLLNAYIKRGSNLLLVDEDQDSIPMKELRLALEESARYLHYFGIRASVMTAGDRIDRETAFELYTAFFEISEALTDCSSLMHIAVEGEALRITSDCAQPPELSPTVSIRERDGLYFFSYDNGKGDAL
ncbi:MAG: hypothetical protein IJG87_07070 [Ruminococcus sp.]|nr:hypothetical protein [Ruminococcus sp.]